ncbi:zinc finger CCCH domain-containing protein 30-like isoform X2 [Phragmites australis]|uniref:zinc finger CCCH domain-containing protein 30-like isoform X2 n=1 Tax=Phragmites australis TaxID=29695 RepID=UPI002D799856|nr:zinc finger CCCH domain-containing protein 30-like isoform X2 [Phragmites australis]
MGHRSQSLQGLIRRAVVGKWTWRGVLPIVKAGPSSDDSLPPGFESLQPTNNLKIDISKVPLIRWRCPPKILLYPDWLVVAGEESEEAALQNERIFGALEAIYPRPSNIPPNPFVSPDVIDSRYDDSQTQLVPLIPVEEDDASDQLEEPPVDLPNNYHQSDKYDFANISLPRISGAPFTTAQQQPSAYIGSTSVGLSTEPDVLAAASAAYTAIMQTNQMGSMIDQDLLIKILSDPAQLERLMKEYGTIKHEQSTTSSVAATMLPGPPPQMAASAPASFPDPVATFHNTNSTLPPPPVINRLPPAIPSVPMNPPASSSQAINFSSAPVRGINYYKTLIHQHGGERQEPLEQHGMQFGIYHQSVPSQTSTVDVASVGAMPGRDNKARLTKPCAYYNSARGCRNGANCTFLHDVSAARKEPPKGAKRVKLDNRIAGQY